MGTSNVDAAYEGGKWAIGQAGDGAKAVIIYGQEGDNTSNMRREGYQKACDEAGVEVLARSVRSEHHRRRHQDHGRYAERPSRRDRHRALPQ